MADTQKAASTIGLKNVVIAPVVSDTDDETTYGEITPVSGAIEASVTPGTTDPEIQHADDSEYDVVYPDPEIEFRTRMVDLPLNVQKMLFSHVIDDNGVLLRHSSDKPGYFAVGFKSEKADHTYRYVWLYKVRAKPLTENYATKEGTTINRQTAEVEWTAIKRNSDGRYQAIADEGMNGFTAEKAKTFLSTVYVPTISVGG